jgi:hypothetical protein
MTKTVTHIDCPKEWGITNDWDSHRPLLYKSICMIPGSVYEMGCGDGSTKLLQDYCTARTFISIETNKDWATKYKNVVVVHDYLDIAYPKEKLAVLFIDCAPAEKRPQLLHEWRNWANVILVHDTESVSEYVYGIQEILSTFKYRLNYEPEGLPHTTAVSDTINICEWICD